MTKGSRGGAPVVFRCFGGCTLKRLEIHCHSFISIGLLDDRPILLNALYIYIDAATSNASMSSIPNGSGPELEKFPHAPPSIEVTVAEDVPDAGLRSLDHCKPS
jgi:hypothetical protein